MTTEQEIFEQIIHTVPFNSFGKTLLAGGQKYPKTFGGNCIFQCREFVNALLSEGYNGDIKFLTAKKRPHWVTLCKNGNDSDVLLFDPFLLHKGEINISKAMTLPEAEPSGYRKVTRISSSVTQKSSYIPSLSPVFEHILL